MLHHRGLFIYFLVFKPFMDQREKKKRQITTWLHPNCAALSWNKYLFLFDKYKILHTKEIHLPEMRNTTVIMKPEWCFVLLLLPLISVVSRADICNGSWKMDKESGKMVAKGRLSANPAEPFIIDFHQFGQLGQFCPHHFFQFHLYLQDSALRTTSLLR